MRTFASGAIRDDNDCKGRCDLIPLDIVINVKEDKPLNLIHNFKVSGEVEHLINLLKLEMNEDIYNVLLDVSHRFGLVQLNTETIIGKKVYQLMCILIVVLGIILST